VHTYTHTHTRARARAYTLHLYNTIQNKYKNKSLYNSIIVRITYRKIKTLTMTVIINNVYSVELLESKLSKVNPTNIFINQLLITETLLMSDICKM